MGDIDLDVVGTYIITYTATDANGNAAVAVTRTVNVVDTTVPVIASVEDVTVEVHSTYTDTLPTATDNYDSSVTVVATGSVNTNVVGTYTITYTATDANGNAAVAVTRTVNVVDTTVPVIASVEDVTVEVHSTYTDTLPTATDNYDSSVTVVATGSVNTNVVGTYTITYTATDANGNAAVAVTRTVNVVDTTVPVIASVEDVTVEGHSTYTDTLVTATDNYDSSVTVVATGSVNTNVVGTYTITYTATDANGNAAVAVTRTVNVVDTTVPVIASVEDVTIEVHSTYTDTLPTATDNYDSRIEVTSMGDIDLDVVGTYTITYTATDANGNAAVAVTRTVNVADTTVPGIASGADVTVEVHSTYTDTLPTATDNYDSSVTVVATGSVNTNVVGTYTITYTATDANGNAAVAVTRTVNVVDTTVPVIAAVEDVTVEVHSTYTDTLPTATDNYDSRIEVTSMGDIDLDVVGTYTITYTATDANGNAAVAVTRTVNVVDTTVPVITLIGDASIEIQRNSTYIELGATVSDNYDTDIEATIDSTNVDMTKLGSYVVTYNATDANGNTATEVTRTIVVVRSDDDKELNRITVNPNTMNYKLYETIDKTAYVVTAIDNDGTTHELTIDDWTHSTLNTSTIGNGRVLTVSYTKNTVTKTATVTYNVSLSEEDLTVEFTAPTLLIYRQDSTLDLTGGKFVITYNENTEQFNLTADEVTITGFNSSTVTESLPVTATLNYHGLNISRVFNVKIIEIKKVWIILTDITTSNPVKEESTLSIEVIAQSAIKEYKYVKFDGNVEDVTYEYISENGTDIVAEGANSTHATNTMTITESGLYCVAARDASIKSRGFECIDITIPDLTKPTLTVNPTTVTIKRGENYDLMTGVSATDNVDNNVKITSSINTTTDLIVGNHVVTYTATDKSGNSITATRTIVVNRNDDDKTIVSITLEAKPNIQLIFQKNVSYNIKEYVNVYKVEKDGVKELANDNEYTINNFSVTSVGTRNMTATLNSITSNTLSYEVRNDSVEQDKFKLFYRADGVYYQTKSYGCTGNNGYCNVAGSNTNKIDKDFSLLEAIEYYEMNIDFSSVRINYTNSSYNETALLLNHTWNYNRKTYTADYSSWKNIDSNSSKWDVARIITTNRTTNSGTTADVMDATHIIDTVEIRYVRTIEHYFAADEIQNWVILFKYNGESQLKAIDEYQVD